MRLAYLSVGIVAALSILATRVRADEIDGLHSCIRRAGDVDGDGISDLMIADRSKTGGPVWIVSGKSRGVLLQLRPKVASDPIARALDCLGDINGDGASDVVVCWRPVPGSYDLNTTPIGHACVYSGRDGSTMFDFRGAWYVAAAGDVDADGTPDILLGSARVQVKSGRDARTVIEFLPGVHATALAGIGDVDGDRHTDILVGAPGLDRRSPGTIVVFSGREGRVLARLEGESEKGENLGWSMATVGDVDRDGIRDVLVGGLHTSAVVCSGRNLHRIQTVGSRGGHVVADAFASSVDRLGDVDGDGVDDWIIGANESVLFDQGYAQVYSGKDAKLLRVEFESRRFGVDVCGVGDVDGDAVADEAIACPGEGWVRLLSGKNGKLIERIDFAKLRESTPKPR